MKWIIQEEKEEDRLQILNKDSEIGIDEVGRGSVFGPVFSAAVVLSKKSGLTLKKLGINDSKKLTPKKRKDVFPKIIALSSDYGLGQSSVREIDLLGIRHATELSMIRAVKKLKHMPSELLIDGPLPLRLWEGNQKNIISGDSKFIS
jgi:ribonuclease HII